MQERAVLRDAVFDALHALGVPFELRPGGLVHAKLPDALLPTFGGSRLRLLFDVDQWRHDRRADLVVPGSAVLVRLEEAVATAGGAHSQCMMGELLPDPSLRPVFWGEAA